MGVVVIGIGMYVCMYVVWLLLLLDYCVRGGVLISTCVPAGPAIHVVFSFRQRSIE